MFVLNFPGMFLPKTKQSDKIDKGITITK